MSRRIRITVRYDGTAYHGWQVQPDFVTVQAELERVLTEIESDAYFHLVIERLALLG